MSAFCPETSSTVRKRSAFSSHPEAESLFTFFIKSAWLVISSACLSFSWEKRCSAAWALAADGNDRIRATLNSLHPLGVGGRKSLHSLSASFKPI